MQSACALLDRRETACGRPDQVRFLSATMRISTKLTNLTLKCSWPVCNQATLSWTRRIILFLISSFRRVQNVVCFLLGDSPASDLYMPTFRNTLSVPSSKADGTDGVFRNVGIYKSDAGESPKRKQTIILFCCKKMSASIIYSTKITITI